METKRMKGLHLKMVYIIREHESNSYYTFLVIHIVVH
jgi:hypothetical protein